MIDPLQAKPLSAEEYECYVASVVDQLEGFSTASISRNRRIPGIRQPGFYEIDIVIEFSMAEILGFLVIIECKNWSRPVDRPVIQKVIQTADAVGAHKAVVVSPLGFTTEAVEVARAHRIALWILAFGKREIVQYERREVRAVPDYRLGIYWYLRRDLLRSLGLRQRARKGPTLVSWDACLRERRFEYIAGGGWPRDRPNSGESWLHRLPTITMRDDLSAIDGMQATVQISSWLDEYINLPLNDSAVVGWVSVMHQKLRTVKRLDLTDSQATRLLGAVTARRPEVFTEFLRLADAAEIVSSLFEE